MRITLNAAGSPPLELAGTGRQGASELRVAFADVVQPRQLFRARSTQPINRGNRLYTISWTTAREHPSAAAADAFLVDHPERLPRVAGALVVEGGAGQGGGTTTRTYPSAVVRITESSARGRTTFTSYEAQASAPNL